MAYSPKEVRGTNVVLSFEDHTFLTVEEIQEMIEHLQKEIEWSHVIYQSFSGKSFDFHERKECIKEDKYTMERMIKLDVDGITIAITQKSFQTIGDETSQMYNFFVKNIDEVVDLLENDNFKKLSEVITAATDIKMVSRPEELLEILLNNDNGCKTRLIRSLKLLKEINNELLAVEKVR